MKRFNESQFNNIYYAVLCDIMKRCGHKEEFENRQEKLVVELLKSKDIDTDDTDICISVSGWLNLLFGDNQKTKQKLTKLKDATSNPVVKNKLKKLIAVISNKQYQEVLEYANKQRTMASADIQQQIVIRRNINYLEYFIIKENNTYYMPNVPYTGNVGEFMGLPQTELLKYFDADKFYKLNSNQKLQLLQAVANDYCKTNGVNSCAVELADLPCSDKAICYGEYMPGQSTILLNKQIFNLLEDAKYSKNPYLPMRLLSTVIHEAQHRVQFENLDNSNKTLKEQMIADSINQNKKFESHSKYLVEPEELDAREATIEYIKQCAQTSDNDMFCKFYNTLILEERKNSKTATPAEVQQYFPNIYGKYAITRGYNLNSAQREFKSLLNQRLLEKE